MRFLYTIGIGFYGLGVRIAALFGHRLARLLVAGWRKPMPPMPSGRVAWFHASSLGEFEQARPVIEALRQRDADVQVVLTFFSPSGYEVRKDYAEADVVLYLPLDTPRNARRLIETMHPTVAFFVKYDHWFNMLHELHRQQIPTYLFSAIFRPGQYLFRPWGRWFLGQIGRCYSHLFVQNEQSLQLLHQHGIAHCTLAGDTRYDRVQQLVQLAPRNAVLDTFVQGCDNGVVVAGSTWPPDERILHQWADTVLKGCKLVVAPHQIHEEHLQQIEVLFPGSVRYSTCLRDNAEAQRARVLIIDNIGMLATLYRYARVAYIGGGFGVGIHNILEAVAYGKPVLFGPNYAKFQEAHDLIALGGAWSIADSAAGVQTMHILLCDNDRYEAAQQACLELMGRNVGSTNIILNHNLFDLH